MSAQGESPRSSSLQTLLKALVKHEGSDLLVKTGAPPVLRLAGDCKPLDTAPLTAAIVKEMIYEILSEEQMADLNRVGAVDLAITAGEDRFRVNVFRERGNVAMAVRRVKNRIPTFADLHLPKDTMDRLLAIEEGLVLVCGPTGSGKTTTIASILDQINATQRIHIATVEDPIEYVIGDRKSFVTQREVGIDVSSFRETLRQVMRQDPDTILIGEMRDGETFDAAIAAAETGHLVFSTLHAASTGQSILRILELYPEARHAQIRLGLFFNLRAIVCQKLLQGLKPEKPRVPATEVMFVTPIVKELIRKAEDHKLPDVVRGAKEKGMHDFNHSLHRLIVEGFITEATGLEASPNPEALQMRLQGITLDEARSGITG